MNKRPLDKTKKSNIKCEHCQFYGLIDQNEINTKYCRIHQIEKNYWNRCNQFEWHDRYK